MASPRFDAAGNVVGVVELIIPAAADIELSDEIQKISQAVKAGKVNQRMPLDHFTGRQLYRAKSINEMLDAISEPLVEVNQVLKKMSNNDLTARVEAQYEGIFAELCESANAVQARVRNAVRILANVADGNFLQDIEELEKVGRRSDNDQFVPAFLTMMRSIHALVTDAQMLSKAAAEGEFQARADVSKHKGEYGRVIEGVNATLDAVVEKMNWFEEIIDAVPFPIHVLDKDMNWIFLNKAFEKLMVENKIIRNRKEAPGRPCSSADANICKTPNCGVRQLEKGIGESYFDWHGQECKQDTSKMVNRKGEHIGYVEVVQDLTSMVRGKNYTNEEVSRLAANLAKLAEGNFALDLQTGEADEHTVEIKQQFDKIAGNLAAVKSAVQAMSADATRLVQAAIEGKLTTRADASKHSGEFRKVVEGVNATLDAVIGPLNVSADYVDKISKGNIPPRITDNYNGDFNTIKNNLNTCIDAIGALVADANLLAQAAVEGKLSTRADASKHGGDFRKIVEGVNATLDAVIGPLNVSADYVDKISKGNIPPRITDNYNGDFNTIKNNLNTCIDAVGALVADSNMLVQAAVEGKLATRADAGKHGGDFRKIIEGVNATLDAVISPLREVSSVLDKLAGGDLTALVINDYAGDFNQLKTAVNTLATQVHTAIQQIGANASSLVSAAEELNKVSQQMSASADQTATQANVVSAASEQVASNVQTVATGADEMGASIKEIAKNTADATRVATAAVKSAEETNETIGKLGQSSAEIGQVIKVITSIAQQTNLLALNATIEAARAGEAGKGFAVVANEVKELAKETAKATEDISRKIEAIQTDTKGAVAAIGQIGTVIVQINDIQNTIASAVEEQSATTNEISRNLAEAAHGSSDITKNISGVAEAARSTTAGAVDTQKSAQSLERMAAELQGLISQFKC